MREPGRCARRPDQRAARLLMAALVATPGRGIRVTELPRSVVFISRDLLD